MKFVFVKKLVASRGCVFNKSKNDRSLCKFFNTKGPMRKATLPFRLLPI